MSDIKAEYLDHMGDDLRVANVARVSFNNWKEELDDKDVRLIDYLAKHEHTSPFRHTFLSVRCTAPIFLARQLGKHQVGLSWNEVSRRYVDSAPEFFVPEEWRARPEGGIKQGSGNTISTYNESMGWEKDSNYSVEDCPYNKHYRTSWITDQSIEIAYKYHLVNVLHFYKDLVESGVAPEMARMVLPQSMLTQWIWSGSLQAFFNIWRLRADGHAQKEAQVFAAQIGQIVSDKFPYCWQALENN